MRGGGVAFPITGGSIDPASAAGRIDHCGGLAFRAGGTRVALRNFRVHVGSAPSDPHCAWAGAA